MFGLNNWIQNQLFLYDKPEFGYVTNKNVATKLLRDDHYIICPDFKFNKYYLLILTKRTGGGNIIRTYTVDILPNEEKKTLTFVFNGITKGPCVSVDHFLESDFIRELIKKWKPTMTRFIKSQIHGGPDDGNSIYTPLL
jgi:hypothetical protein